MDEREFEAILTRALRQDFSAGTEKFRNALLVRCLAELDADSSAAELDDGELEPLAAAGVLNAEDAAIGDNGLKQGQTI